LFSAGEKRCKERGGSEPAVDHHQYSIPATASVDLVVLDFRARKLTQWQFNPPLAVKDRCLSCSYVGVLTLVTIHGIPLQDYQRDFPTAPGSCSCESHQHSWGLSTPAKGKQPTIYRSIKRPPPTLDHSLAPSETVRGQAGLLMLLFCHTLRSQQFRCL
jgi:hypothetical protein